MKHRGIGSTICCWLYLKLTPKIEWGKPPPKIKEGRFSLKDWLLIFLIKRINVAEAKEEIGSIQKDVQAARHDTAIANVLSLVALAISIVALVIRVIVAV